MINLHFENKMEKKNKKKNKNWLTMRKINKG